MRTAPLQNGIRPGEHRRTAIGLLALLAVALPLGPAHGHTRLSASEPADGATLAAGSTVITLRFSEPIQPRFSDFTLHFLGARPDTPLSADNRLARPQPVPDDTRRTVSLPLPEAPVPGWYALDWQVLAEDGHSTEGTQRFQIPPPAR